uniref:Centrosome-associated FAM110 C-terminal domain-containing protein n=1 Tax=Clastoptera arizonana TaxID=38151 RepID=A0A1B6CH84_9HEMI
MAATSMRPQNHCLQTPLKTLNRGNHFYRATRSSIAGNHKSAVELLQETKCLYVKSETVLDHHQQLKSPLPSEPEFTHSTLVRHVRGPPVPPKSPHLASSSLRRSYNSTHSSGDQLQTKLRRLLNADSKENLIDDVITSDVRKSPRWNRRCNSQSQEKTLTGAQMCPVHHKSLPDLHSGVSSSSDTSEPASCEYTLYTNRKSSSPRQSTGETVSVNSSRSKSRHSRSHSHESTSTSSSSNDRLPPTSPVKSSVSYGGSAGKAEALWVDDGLRLRPILRSKSDVGHRCTKLTTISQPSTPADLETFFNQLGLDSAQYKLVATSDSQNSSPVFFSDTSSVDSQILCSTNRSTGGSGGASNQVTELPSIVERNARIIKWLCNCRKAQSSNMPVKS